MDPSLDEIVFLAYKSYPNEILFSKRKKSESKEIYVLFIDT